MGLYGWLTLAWIAVIFLGGAGAFGRAGTQRMIDRLQHTPWVHRLLDRYHGELRAAWHYVEFGALSLVLYLLIHSRWGAGPWTWWAALVTLLTGTVIAYLDEKRQELTPGRQFRWHDFWCSIRGLAWMQLFIAGFALTGA
ncbi:MAG: VanZ family protein [Candidatus Sumerlaeia bacterium]|nr:VanZ family protein [Candidatus Sumerlaeia bacterium]